LAKLYIVSLPQIRTPNLGHPDCDHWSRDESLAGLVYVV
jgi:hypothetical protein